MFSCLSFLCLIFQILWYDICFQFIKWMDSQFSYKLGNTKQHSLLSSYKPGKRAPLTYLQTTKLKRKGIKEDFSILMASVLSSHDCCSADLLEH